MSVLADLFPNLAQHWRVLRVSWRSQNIADKAFKPREEHEFLPAALEIMEKPPSPGLRWLMLLTCTLFVLALVWSFIGRMDVVAVASGKTVPAGNVKIVQSIEIGSVRAIHVKNGQYVEQGQLLIELDPTLAVADEAQSEQTLLAARILKARNAALLAHLDGRPAVFDPPDGTPPATLATEQAFVRRAVAQFDAQQSALAQQRSEHEAERQGSMAEIAKLQEALPYIEEQLSARAELTERGFYSRLRLLEYEQLRAEHLRTIEVQQSNKARADAAIGRIDAELRSLRADFGKTAITQFAEADGQAILADEELRKAARRRQFQELRAPEAGVVQQLAVNTLGGVVQPAQALMVIVPCSRDSLGTSACDGGISVEAYIQNKDIGYIALGQEVAIKLETFNFTDYGVIDGVVETISRDSIASPNNGQPPQTEAGNNAAPQGPVYAAKIQLRCGANEAERSPLCDSITPGMSAQAEIKTGQRRIIQYLLSPISQSLSEAGRER